MWGKVFKFIKFIKGLRGGGGVWIFNDIFLGWVWFYLYLCRIYDKIFFGMELRGVNGLWIGGLVLSAFVWLTGCESMPSVLPEPGSFENNKDIFMVDSIYARGLKGFLIEGRTYTELSYTDVASSKHTRVQGMRKGTALVEGSIESVTWESVNPVILYGGSGNSALSYTYNGLKTEVITNNNQHAETVINTYSDGRMHSQLSYTYNSAGYLVYVRIERPGREVASVSYIYPDLLNPAGGDEIAIAEYPGPTMYYIRLAVDKVTGGKVRNESYICNVLRQGKGALTNEYVINPDLYYLGIYGTPYKYLPDATIESSVGVGSSGILRVGDVRYFYYR
jgi:hypothetical protein